jgi:hypothetical protein
MAELLKKEICERFADIFLPSCCLSFLVFFCFLVSSLPLIVQFPSSKGLSKGLFVWAVAGWLSRESCYAGKADVQ